MFFVLKFCLCDDWKNISLGIGKKKQEINIFYPKKYTAKTELQKKPKQKTKNKKTKKQKIKTKVCGGVYTGVKTTELDELAAETAAHMVTQHPDYGLLAARIEVSNLHKNTKKVFSDVIEDLYNYVNPRTGLNGPLISDEIYQIVRENQEKLNSAII